MAEKNGRVGLPVLGVLVALGALGMTVHGVWVVPAVLHKAGEAIDAEIKTHETRPHVGSMTHSQFTQLLGRLDRIDERLLNLERRE